MGYSFKSLIEDKYLSNIEERIKPFLYHNYKNIYFKTHLDYIKYISYNESSIEKVYIKGLNDASYKLMILVSSNIELHGDNFNSECREIFLLIKAFCKFDEDLSDFYIYEIEEYNKEKNFDYDLTDMLIPYIKKEKYDTLADEIIKEYYKEFYYNNAKMDPIILAKRLGLTIKYVKFKDSTISGKIYFDDTKLSNGNIVPKNTIKVNANYNKNIQNFTILHECAHYLLHRRAFKLQKIYLKRPMWLELNKTGITLNASIDSQTVKGMEQQANFLASSLLISSDALKYKFEREYDSIKLLPKIEQISQLDQLIFKLAKDFNSSISAMKIRLINLGYDIVRGFYIYVDGKKLRPYLFNSKELASDETYAICENDMQIFISTTKMDLSLYNYVESHICLIHSKYVKRDNNNLYLTDYARCHLDECAIKFKVDLRNEKNNDLELKDIRVLNRKSNNEAELVVKAIREYNKKETFIHNAEYDEALIRQANLYKRLTTDPASCLKKIKEYSGFTRQELQDLTHLSRNTVENYLSGNTNYKQSTLLNLLFNMQCPSDSIEHVLKQAGCQIIYNKGSEQLYLQTAIMMYWYYPIEKIKEYLISNNVNIF